VPSDLRNAVKTRIRGVFFPGVSEKWFWATQKVSKKDLFFISWMLIRLFIDVEKWVCVFFTTQKKIFSPLQDAFEFLFEDVNTLLNVFNVLATRQNDLS